MLVDSRQCIQWYICICAYNVIFSLLLYIYHTWNIHSITLYSSFLLVCLIMSTCSLSWMLSSMAFLQFLCFYSPGSCPHLFACHLTCILTTVSSHYFCSHCFVIDAIYKLLFQPLLCSWYLHSVASFLRWPIHSSAIFSIFLTNLQYCSDSIVSLYCGVEFTLSTMDNPFAVLAFFLVLWLLVNIRNRGLPA